MIPYTTFRSLLSDVQDCYTFDLYCAGRGCSIPTDDPVEAHRILSVIWTMARGGLSIKSISAACELPVRQISMQMDIPSRTAEAWAMGERTPPAWQLPLIAYAVLGIISQD